MDLRLVDSIIFVAGSTRGIGQAIAHAFLAEGARVVVTGRQGDSLAKTRAAFDREFGEERVLAWQGDLTRPQHLSTPVEAIEPDVAEIDVESLAVGHGRL